MIIIGQNCIVILIFIFHWKKAKFLFWSNYEDNFLNDMTQNVFHPSSIFEQI